MAALSTVYIKPELSCIVSNKRVTLGEICDVYAQDVALAKEIRKIEILHLEKTEKQKIAMSVIYLVQKISDVKKDVTVVNVGEGDFLIEYQPPVPKKKWKGQLKVALVSVIVFFGSAFTIMTFNEDANVAEVFTRIYQVVAGMDQGNGWLEISYCIGMPLGILLFFNHFSSAKLSADPTPLQIQMRQYEQQENVTIIENEARGGKRIE